MKFNIPEISQQIYKEDLTKILEKNYPIIGPLWVTDQMEWLNSVYSSFRNHDKFLILIYLIKKTLDFYAGNLIKVTYDDFYLKNKVDIAKFNVREISLNINIPKESARRKIVELEKISAIIRDKKKLQLTDLHFHLLNQ